MPSGMKRRRTIRGDLILFIGGAVLFSVLIIGTVFFIYVSVTLSGSLERASTRTANEIARTLEEPLYTLNDEMIRNAADAYLSTGKLLGIVITSTATGVIVDKPPVSTTVSPVSITVSRGSVELGSVKLWFDDSELRSAQRRLTLLTALFMLGILIAYVLSMNIIARKILSRPLAMIMKGIEAVSGGNYLHRIPEGTHEDLNILVGTLNRMAESILTANRRITESEQRYSAIFNSSAVAIMLVDRNEKIVDVNDSMLRMFGLESRQEAMQYSIDLDYNDPSNDPAVLSAMKNAAEEGSELFFSWTARRPIDGTAFHTEVTFRKVTLADGEFTLVQIIDVSDRRKIEEQLVQAQKMEAVGTIAGGLAHDFNNILGGITGSVSLLQLKAGKDEPIPKETLLRHLEQINSAAFRAADVVKKLLTLSKKQEFHAVPLDLRDIVRHVVPIIESTVDRSIGMGVEYPEEPAAVRGDATQLEQVLLNLLVNSSHAMTVMRPEGEVWGGQLVVSFSRCLPDEVFRRTHPLAKQVLYHVVSVTDTGVGISAEGIRKLFVPFYTTKVHGTGLGLSMVYNIVKAHDGFINVYSEKGIGTTFSVYIPAQTGTDRETGQTAHEPETFKGEGLVIVIDDERHFRENLRDILSEFGFEILEADNGEDGFRLFSENRERTRFVMLDMVMTKQSGKETFRKIRQIAPDMKIILMSGFSHDPRIQSIMKDGVSAFLQKPFYTASLIEALRKVENA